jgi:diacylglycerol kinase (ATP)
VQGGLLTDRSRIRVVVNPVSGRGAGARSIPEIRQRLDAYGMKYEIVVTERPWHGAEVAGEAAVAGCDVVVAVGGDGTANEVLNGLMQAWERHPNHGCAMAAIGVGRGNDFAFGVGIPQGIEPGCRTLASGKRRTIDVGRVVGGQYPQGRYFGNGVGIGFDAVVGFEALKLKRLSGFPSYVVATLKTVFLYFTAPLLRISYDAGSLEMPALLVSVMNGRRMGGGFLMAPRGDVADGLFDLCIARQVSRARVFGLVPHFVRGSQLGQPEILAPRSRRVEVTALRGVLPAHADGETLCEQGERLAMEVVPGKLDVLVPAGVEAR